MKKNGWIVSLTLIAALLSGCATSAPPSFDDAPDSSSVANTPYSSGTDSLSSSDDNSSYFEPPQESSSAVSESVPSSSEPIPTTAELTFYDSFRDIPFAELEYEETVREDGSGYIQKGYLMKNGEPWYAAPGMMEFGERCFTDGTSIWFQVFINNGTDDFDWLQVCIDHFHNEGVHWTTITEVVGDPPKTTATNPLQNKIFTHADGYTIYTDDGFSYTITPCPYLLDSSQK